MPEPRNFYDRLTDRVAIVTGAGSQGSDADGVGIGKAIAILFAREGAKLCLVDREPERAESTRRLIEAAGGQAIVVGADVTSEADCERIVSETVAHFGAPDILVNSVGISGGETLRTLDLANWQRMIDVNLKSAILMCRAVLDPMSAAGGGAIVNIASIAGIRRYGSLGYGPSKAGLIALTAEIALAHGAENIRVNAVAPGHVQTPHVAEALPDNFREQRRRAGPLGIEGDAWDIAAATLFLASSESRFITGTCIPVDGGVTEVGSLAAQRLING